jgi:hypothetical protein
MGHFAREARIVLATTTSRRCAGELRQLQGSTIACRVGKAGL